MATVDTSKTTDPVCSECGHTRSKHFEMRWPEDPNHCLVEGCECDYFCWPKEPVAPPAPDPALRERIAAAIAASTHVIDFGDYTVSETDYDEAADAVLAVIAGKAAP